MVLDVEAGVLFGQPGQRLRQLLLLALVPGSDCQAEHGSGERQGGQMNVVLVMGVMQDGIEMDVIDLGHGRYVAGDGRIDFLVFLAQKAEQVPDLEGLAAVVDEQLAVLADGALVHAKNAQFADKRVVDDAEHVSDHVLLGVRLGDDRPGPGPLALDERWRIALGRIGQQSAGNIQPFAHPGTAPGAGEADRHKMTFAQALLECVVQFVTLECFLAAFQVAPHGLLVDLDHLVDDLLMPVGDAGEVRVASRRKEAVHYRACVFGGQVQRQTLIAELGAKLLDQPGQIGIFRIHVVDHQHPRQAPLRGMVHDPARVVFDAAGGIDNHGTGFHRSQGRQGGAAKIGVAGGVNDVETA